MTEKEHFFWNKLLELAKEELTQATFDYYVLDTKLIKVQDNVATILLEEVKKLFWEKNMQSFILMAGFEAYNSEIKVEYVFDEALLNEANSTVTNNDFGNKKEQQTPALPTLDSDLNSKYTFDNFIQGDENRWSVAASLAVADSPGATYNPLFIYGGPGLGKTHLLNAIGNKVLHDNPQARIKYITAENFINEFVVHIRLDKMDELKLKYRHLDVLLIDDIQSLAKKSTQATQEEFFNTFNVLHNNNKQIVLTSDRNPDQLNEMEERLVTRFKWGLTVNITPPDFETRVAILTNKIMDYDYHFPPETISFYTRLLEGNYPDTNRLLSDSFETEVVFEIASLRSAMERSYLISNASQSGTVKLEIINGSVSAHVNSPEVGKVNEDIDVQDVSGSDLVISFNPTYLIDALKALKSETVRVRFISPVRPFTLTPADDSENFIQLITPVRTN